MDITIIRNKIHELRGQRVMLDFDLAQLYDVTTGALNQSVKRNMNRFPEDFMFQLTEQEYERLISQFVTSNLKSQIATSRRGGTRKLPYAFTEQGVAMLSGLLRSDVAVEVNINIMRAFVVMRHYILEKANESVELAQLRERVLALEHAVNDNLEAVNDLSEDVRRDLDNIYLAIGELSVKPAPKPREPIGYRYGKD